MKFKDFLNDSSKLIKNFDNDNISNILEKECSEYLSLLKSKGLTPFIRRIWMSNISVLPPLLYNKVRKDRVPLGRPETFALLNNWLEKNGHCRRDQSVIAISKEKTFSSVFGNLPTLIFPKGKFKYSFVRSSDIHLQRDEIVKYKMRKEKIEKVIDELKKEKFLFSDEFLWIFFSDKIKKSVYESMYNYPPKEIVVEIEKIFPKYFETNKKIEEAHKNTYEIWFDCDDYYLLNTNLIDKTKKIVKKLDLPMPKGF